jgi:hypothetical protein
MTQTEQQGHSPFVPAGRGLNPDAPKQHTERSRASPDRAPTHSCVYGERHTSAARCNSTPKSRAVAVTSSVGTVSASITSTSSGVRVGTTRPSSRASIAGVRRIRIGSELTRRANASALMVSGPANSNVPVGVSGSSAAWRIASTTSSPVQRSQLLGPTAEQRDFAGLRDERRCGRAGLPGRAVDVIAPENDRWSSTRAQRVLRLGLVAQVRVRRVEPRGQEAEEDHTLGL